MRPVPERPILPQTFPPHFQGTLNVLGQLVVSLVGIFGEIGYRLNRTLPKDGSEVMDGPLPLVSYEASALPPAADHEGSIVYVSDGGAGTRFRGSDGSNWLDLG